MIYSLFNRENLFLLIERIIASSLLQYIFTLDDDNNRKRKKLFINSQSEKFYFFHVYEPQTQRKPFRPYIWWSSHLSCSSCKWFPHRSVLNVFFNNFRTFSIFKQTFKVKFLMDFYWFVCLVAMTSVEQHDFYVILKLNVEFIFQTNYDSNITDSYR